jgi:hypothetical protein
MISRAEQNMKLTIGLEDNAANVRLGIDGEQRVFAVRRPYFYLGVV